MCTCRMRTANGCHQADCLKGLRASRCSTRWWGPADEPAEVVIGIETDRGLFVGALVAAGYAVFAVNLMSTSRHRDWHSTSGCRVHLFVQCPDLELHGAPACGYDHRRDGRVEARRGANLWCHRTASFSRSRRSIGASSIWTQQVIQPSTEGFPAVRWFGSGVSVDVVCCFSEIDGGRRWALPGGDPAVRARPRGRE
jgi:hypothetical protein